MKSSTNQQTFFALLRAGLWEQEVRLSQFGDIEYSALMQLAEEQSVIGLVTAGLEHVTDIKVPKVELLQFIGSTLQIEKQNKSLNEYIAWLFDDLRKEDVFPILVKGQGIAQCYEKPLWRTSGDIDLLLSNSDYKKAKKVMIPRAIEVENEYNAIKHIGMTMKNGIVVELHGTLHSRLSKRVDKVIDEVQKDVLDEWYVRSWQDANTTVYLPSPDNDIIFVFTHILHHFYIDGIGIRQICDWCRLLWTFRSNINIKLLEQRLRKAGLVSEWKAFAALAVDWLGMPVDAMPLYSTEEKWKRKAGRALVFVLKAGNFGHNNNITHHKNYLHRKISAAWRKIGNISSLCIVFPLHAIRVLFHFMGDGLCNAARGE